MKLTAIEKIGKVIHKAICDAPYYVADFEVRQYKSHKIIKKFMDYNGTEEYCDKLNDEFIALQVAKAMKRMKLTVKDLLSEG